MRLMRSQNLLQLLAAATSVQAIDLTQYVLTDVRTLPNNTIERTCVLTRRRPEIQMAVTHFPVSASHLEWSNLAQISTPDPILTLVTSRQGTLQDSR